MQEKIQQTSTGYFAKNHRCRTWKTVVSVLSGIVVFCTTYALILPAITLENHTAYCGFEAHRHSPECYEKTLACSQAETENTAYDCTDESGTSDAVPTWVSETAEGEEPRIYAHTDECYKDETDYAAYDCTDEDSISETMLTCVLETAEGGEPHAHVHTDECYRSVLTCAREEHTHELGCYSNPDADLEFPEDWSHSVSYVKLTGSWRADLIAVAESQLGYTESDKNYKVDEDGITKKGYTRYGAWYGDPYGEWSAMFISFCLNYADIPDEAIPRTESCSQWIELLQKEEYSLYRAKEMYTPQIGDLIFVDRDENRIADHVGLVAELLEATETDPAMIRTVEGNSDGCVQYAAYSFDDVRILGYGELPEEPRVEYRWSQSGLEVVAYVRESENLPENASLTVRTLLPEDEENLYGERYAESQERIAAENFAKITRFDLFRVSLEADGKEVLPQADAAVEIRLMEDDPSVLLNVELFHYSEEGAESASPEWDEASGRLIGSFDTALSGEYAIVGMQKLSDGPQILADTADTPTSTDAASDETVLTPHKRIDAFRDGADNPDTLLDNNQIDKTDLYRLYLDAEMSMVNKPIDLLIVVDQSGSMHNDYSEIPWGQPDDYYLDMTKENGEKAYRDEALRLILNGTSSTDRKVYESNKQNGLIYQFLKANPENKVCVVGFQGNGNGDKYRVDKEDAHYKTDNDGNLADVKGGWLDEKGTPTALNNHTGDTYIDVYSGIADTGDYLEAATLFNWTSDPTFVDVRGIYGNATNYTAAFVQAQRALDDPAADDGHQKVILFLSDGNPTCHIVYGGREAMRPSYLYPAIPEHYYRDGNGLDEDGPADTWNWKPIKTGAATDTAFKDFMDANHGVILHTVSICGDNKTATRLQKMADGYGEFYTASKTDELRINLRKLMFGALYTELTIEDTLSQYVDLHDQPDFKVTRKENDGSVTVLYENGTVTDAGIGVIKDVTYDSVKTVTAVFESTYTATPGSTVTLSFNVKTNQKAYEEYAKNGYSGVEGDANTDYGENSTSSGQGGFHSNASATVTYKKDGTVKSDPYPYPVVQAVACKAAVQKTDSRDSNKTLPDAEFTLYRKALSGETGEPLEGIDGSYVKVSEKLTTDTDGKIIFDKLIPGDYCLVETKSPDGYKKLAAPVSFTLSRKSDGAGQIVGSERTITVGNETLSALQVANAPWGRELPQTGGDGAVPYIMGGILLMTSAGILLLCIKYKRRNKDFTSS